MLGFRRYWKTERNILWACAAANVGKRVLLACLPHQREDIAERVRKHGFIAIIRENGVMVKTEDSCTTVS